MLTRTAFFVIILMYWFGANAQVSDDFEDGDFTSNPVWVGETTKFQVTAAQLNTNGSGSDEIFLSTPSTLIDNAVWEFYLQINGTAPSGSNRARIYLVSDNADLENTLNGYYIQIGQTGDDFVNLYRSDGGVGTLLFSGATAFDDQVRIKVSRDASGTWNIYTDHSGERNFMFETSGTDNTYTASSHFGWVIDHTSSRVDDFFLDDVLIDQLRIDSVQVQNNLALKVYFNQNLNTVDAETTSNYSIAGLTISSAVQDVTNKSIVTLTLDNGTPLVSNDYLLEISTSLSNNEIDTESFSYLALALTDAVTPDANTLLLSFNSKLDETQAETLTNFSVDNGIGSPSAAELSADAQSIILTFANTFTQGVNYQVNLSSLENESGNSTLTTSSSFNYVIPLLLQSVQAISKNTALATFNKSLNTTTGSENTNYALSNGIGNPTTAVIQAETTEVVLTFSSNFTDDNFVLTATGVTDTDDNVISTAGNTASFDYLNLAISSIAQEDENTLRISFNQNLDKTSAETNTHYEIADYSGSISADLDAANLNEVVLGVSGLRNSTYTVQVNGVSNTVENSTADNLSTTFDFETASTFREIVINEVMADFTVPSGETPTDYNGEYVELYNPGEASIRLENFRLNNKLLPAYALPSEEYVLIVDNSSATSFSSVTNLIVINNFDALSTPNDSVVLRDQFKNLIDSISYREDWFDDEIKEDGGYSLEQINPNLTCSEDNNWTATLDNSGGTPGIENSVFSTETDISAPTLSSLSVIGADTIYLVFDEPIDESSIDLSDFSLDGDLPSKVVVPSYTDIYIILGSDLISEQFHNIEINTISDCSGNVISTITERFYHDLASPVLQQIRVIAFDQVALIFNEPLKESDAERESNYLLNGTTEPDNATLQDSASNRVHLTFEEVFVQSSYTLSFENIEDTLSNVAALSTSFDFKDQVDSILVIAPRIIQVDFDIIPSDESGLQKQNFLLEGTTMPTEILFDKSDSSRLLLVFDSNFEENDDLTLFIERLFDRSGSPIITPSKSFVYDTRAPSIEQVTALSDTILQILFNEPIDTLVASSSSSYLVESTYNPIEVLFESSKEVRLVFAVGFETEKELRVHIRNIQDLYGNAFASSRTEEFVYDPLPPRISAILQVSDTVIQMESIEKLNYDLASPLALYDLEGNMPQRISIQGPDSLIIKLEFSDIAESEALVLVIDSLVDQFGNVSDEFNISLNTQQPNISDFTFLSDTSGRVVFSKSMVGLGSVGNYSLEEFDLVAVSEIYNTEVHLIFDALLQSNDTLTLEVANIEGSSGQFLQNTSISAIFNSYVDQISFLDARTLNIQTSTRLQTLNRNDFQLAGIKPSLATISGEEDEDILLYFDDDVTQNVSLELAYNAFHDFYGRLFPATKRTISYDTEKPTFESLEVQFFGIVDLTFSEKIELTTLESVSSYELISTGRPDNVLSLNDSTVRLDFRDALVQDQTYQLIVKNLSDQAGNFSITDTIQFDYSLPTIPEAGDLLITEIMADPSPKVGLPELEYFEIYNNADYAIDLRTVKVGKKGSLQALSSGVLNPEEYLMIAAENTIDQFAALNKRGISNMPSLGNTTDSLLIQTIYEEEVDAVYYSSDWYGDTDKDNGGYSLELINPDPTCPVFLNWTASESTTGGTPGAQNSVYSLNPDTESPTITSFEILEDTVVATFSEYMDSLSVVNGTYTGFAIDRVIFNQTTNVLQLVLGANIERGEEYALVLSGAQDCSGNAMENFSIQLGDGLTPELGDVLITEIFADPSPAIGLPEVEYIELYNKSDLTFDLDVLVISDPTKSHRLPSRQVNPEDYILLVAEGNEDLFAGDNVVGVSGLLSLGNSEDSLTLTNIYNEEIDAVYYSSDWYGDTDKDDGGYSLELINPDPTCPVFLNWTASESTTGGTPGAQNSVYSLNPDTESPTITSFEILEDTVVATFSEYMDSLSVVNGTYTGFAIDRVIFNQTTNVLQLVLGANIERGEEYALVLSGAQDCSGNAMASFSITLGDGPIPELGNVLITEIFADPSPAIGLPEVEYIELYNKSDLTFDLDVLVISDPTKSHRLPSRLINPEDYILLVAEGNEDLFAGDNVVGVSGLLSLGNNEDSLTLTNIYEEEIDAAYYSSDWYGDTDKDDGGYSLELINPDPTCPVFLNWTASESTTGGTPGAQNSVYSLGPDTEAPTIIDFEVLEDTVAATFSEYMDSLSVVNGTYTGFAIDRVIFNQTTNVLQLVLGANIERGEEYALVLSGAQDCSGNVMASFSITLGDGPIPELGNVLITEIFADPSPSIGLPEVEYIELYNKSDLTFDLDVLVISDPTKSHRLPSRQVNPEDYILLVAEGNEDLFTEDNVVGVSSLLSLSNNADSLTLTNIYDEKIDTVYYDRSWYRDTEKDDGGYSLELINPTSPCPSATNWRASENEQGGTPGFQNSVYSLNPDQEPPIIVFSEIIGLDQLTIDFNEILDQQSLTPTNISGVQVSEVSLAEDLSTVIIQLTNELMTGQEYILNISGFSDCSGNIMETTSIVVGIGRRPFFNEIIITEIHPDPDPVIALPSDEFLEVYNATDDLISLEGSTLITGDDTVSLPGVAIRSKEYLILSPVSAVLAYSEFGEVTGISGWVSLSNSSDYLAINYDEELIFDIEYFDTWHDMETDGGRSLEMKDITNPCAFEKNWGTSVSNSGGTPGSMNSITESIPDNFGATLESLEVISATAYLALFNERLSVNNVSALSVQIQPEIAISSLNFTNLLRNEIAINTSDVFMPNQEYTVTLSRLSDCNGNLSEVSGSFVFPDSSVSTEIIINEVLFNPKDDGVDFVEIYNNSDRYINLKNWQIGRVQEGEITQTDVVSTTNLIISPRQYLALTTNPAMVKSQFPTTDLVNTWVMSGMPTYPNTEGTVVLIRDNLTLIDQFDYDEDLHTSLLESVDGVSLERISFDDPTNEDDNWISASSLTDFATPGYENSQILNGSRIAGKLTIEPKVFVPGSGGSVVAQSFTTINYQFSTSGMFANVYVYNQNGQLINTLANGASLSTQGFIRWDGTNQSGNVVRMGYYVVVFELYDGSGNQEVLRETVVVGR